MCVTLYAIFAFEDVIAVSIPSIRKRSAKHIENIANVSFIILHLPQPDLQSSCIHSLHIPVCELDIRCRFYTSDTLQTLRIVVCQLLLISVRPYSIFQTILYQYHHNNVRNQIQSTMYHYHSARTIQVPNTLVRSSNLPEYRHTFSCSIYCSSEVQHIHTDNIFNGTSVSQIDGL